MNDVQSQEMRMSGPDAIKMKSTHMIPSTCSDGIWLCVIDPANSDESAKMLSHHIHVLDLSPARIERQIVGRNIG